MPAHIATAPLLGAIAVIVFCVTLLSEGLKDRLRRKRARLRQADHLGLR